jgi:hypothetical protein
MSPQDPDTIGVTAIQRAAFVKHVKNIGRAYRKQARELVACYRQASKEEGHRSAELRK